MKFAVTNKVLFVNKVWKKYKQRKKNLIFTLIYKQITSVTNNHSKQAA
jgi:DUF438 domain-containing protein